MWKSLCHSAIAVVAVTCAAGGARSQLELDSVSEAAAHAAVMMNTTLDAVVTRTPRLEYDPTYDPALNKWLDAELASVDVLAVNVTVSFELPANERIIGVQGRIVDGWIIESESWSAPIVDMGVRVLLVNLILDKLGKVPAELVAASYLKIVDDGWRRLSSPELSLGSVVDRDSDSITQLSRLVEFDMLLAAKVSTSIRIDAIETVVVGGASAGERRIYPVSPLPLADVFNANQ